MIVGGAPDDRQTAASKRPRDDRYGAFRDHSPRVREGGGAVYRGDGERVRSGKTVGCARNLA